MTVILPARVTLSPEVLVQELEGEAVMLDLQGERYYGLNDVGLRMWQLLAEHGAPEAVVTRMLAEYEVEEAPLRRDLASLIENLAARGLIAVESAA